MFNFYIDNNTFHNEREKADIKRVCKKASSNRELFLRIY